MKAVCQDCDWFCVRASWGSNLEADAKHHRDQTGHAVILRGWPKQTETGAES